MKVYCEIVSSGDSIGDQHNGEINIIHKEDITDNLGNQLKVWYTVEGDS